MPKKSKLLTDTAVRSAKYVVGASKKAGEPGVTSGSGPIPFRGRVT
jgi:hypothetical protein